MEGGLLITTYFLAGRTTRISQDGAVATARGAARVAAWTTQAFCSSARLLNPFNWRKRASITHRRRLQKEILEISAAEQRRIGQNLHNGVGQILSGVAFMSRALERKLAAELPDGAADAAQIAEIAEKAMARTRSMARVLNPVRLESDGLTVALGEMASDFEKLFGVSCTFEHPEGPLLQRSGSAGDARVLDIDDDDAVAMHLYRIAQEAATNAIRHGGAKHVVMGLSRTGERAALTVQDDGTGFEAGEATGEEATGMGLRIMDYRAQMIGGTLTIRRRPEGGTLLTCAFPSRAR